MTGDENPGVRLDVWSAIGAYRFVQDNPPVADPQEHSCLQTLDLGRSYLPNAVHHCPCGGRLRRSGPYWVYMDEVSDDAE